MRIGSGNQPGRVSIPRGRRRIVEGGRRVNWARLPTGAPRGLPELPWRSELPTLKVGRGNLQGQIFDLQGCSRQPSGSNFRPSRSVTATLRVGFTDLQGCSRQPSGSNFRPSRLLAAILKVEFPTFKVACGNPRGWICLPSGSVVATPRIEMAHPRGSA
jgi:hypothetical protein